MPSRPRSSWSSAFLATILVVAALYFAREIFIPIALALLLAFLLAPICARLERARVPRVIAIAIVMLIAGSVVGGAGWMIEGQAYQLASQLPEYKSSIISKLQALRLSHGRVLGEATRAIAEVGREISAPASNAPGASSAIGSPASAPVPVKVVEVPSPPFDNARAVLAPFLGPAATAIVVVIFAIFVLLKREDLRDRLLKILGERSLHITTPALDDAAVRVTRYLLLQSMLNGTVGICVGLALFLLGVPGALVWGLLTALLRFVPYVGAWIAAGFPIILSLAIAPDFRQPLSVAASIAGIELVAGQLVEPLLFASGAGVSPIALLVSALFWTWLWGPVGLLLSTPLTVCLAVLGRHIPSLSFLNTLLGDSVALAPETRLYQRLLAGDQEEAARIVDESPAPAAVERFDALLLPALRLAEAGRHRGQLDDLQQRSITDLMSVLIEDLSPRPAPIDSPPDAPLIACIASRDAADELASRMLRALLAATGSRVESIPADSLTGETIERIAALQPAAVCISALPPAAALHTRVLCKRIRRRFPALPIVVGFWDSALDRADARARLGDVGTEYTVTTLTQALATLDALVPRTPLADPVQPSAQTTPPDSQLDTPATTPTTRPIASAPPPGRTLKPRHA